MMNYKKTAILIVFLLFPFISQANNLSDRDFDGVPDMDEVNIYHTDPDNWDTDQDGYSDYVELNFGFTPLSKEPLLLEESDYDGDGLSDRMELNFGTDLSLKDTDQDGFSDWEEIESGYDPNNAKALKLEKRIEVNIAKQELSNFLGGVRLHTFVISSGKNNSTPLGHFEIVNKNSNAWSATYGLWMPWWMGLDRGSIGLHQLPYWPSGYVEGEDHLGTPVSHGCIRLGSDNAEYMYNWTPLGTEVFIY
jgi:hypothetical protein